MRMAAACLAIVLATASAASGSDFTYQVPDGFRELRTATRPGNVDESNVPPDLVKDALNSRYVLVAIDPRSTTSEKVGATFNVVEANTTGHMTLDIAMKAVDGIVAELRKRGIPANVIDASVVPMNGIDTAVLTFELRERNAPRRTRQYIIPGPHNSAVLSYSAPRADFERYYPAFLRSVRATQVAGAPPPESAKWNWKEFFLWGLIGALGGAALYIIRKFIQKGGDEGAVAAQDAAPKKEPPRRASKHLWYCEQCGKPVPIRLDQCRCGGIKPA
jgi:hypothetical protein